MRLNAKTGVISTSAVALFLVGCSSTQTTLESHGDYRESETEIVQTLEMPPNLFNPGKAKSSLALALAQVEKVETAKAKIESNDFIPTFKAEGIYVASNLSERWLEIDSVDSDKVWLSVKRFLSSSGFAIASERKDIGVLQTEYQQRTELVPLAEVSALTRVLNSWRPELAEGVYDKYTVRLETDAAMGKTRVYFNHSMLYSPEANEVRDLEERWSIKPYSPKMEALALYQAMVFLGSTSDKAIAQLNVSEKMIELVEGEEFNALLLNSDLDSSWRYLQAMVYRSDWAIESMSKEFYKLSVKIPDALKKEQGLLSSLAFWKEADKQVLPDVVIFHLRAEKDQVSQSALTVDAEEGVKPLTAEQRRYIFENLGLLAK